MTPNTTSTTTELINHIVGLQPGQPPHTLRHQQVKMAAASPSSYNAVMYAPGGMSRVEKQGAGTSAREKAITQFSIDLTRSPGALGAEHVQALKDAGLSPIEIFDLINSVAIFAWANRLMLNLGEPVLPSTGLAA